MDLNGLRDSLRQQVNTANRLELSEAKLTSIDNNLLPPDNLGNLIAQSLNFPEKTIIINSISASDIPDPNGRNELIITKGVVTWFETELSVKYLKFSVKNTNPQPRLSFILQITLGDSWTFSNHFPMLDGFTSDEVKFSNCNYIFSTDDQPEFTWNLENNQDTISLQLGLNFVSHFEIINLSLLTNFLTFTSANSSLKDFTLFGKIIPNACNCTVDVDESTSLSEIIYFPIFDFKTSLITRNSLNFSVLKITAPILGISAEEVDADTYEEYYPQIYLGLSLLKQDNTPPSLDIYATFIPNSSFLRLIVLPQELSVNDLLSFIPIINEIWNNDNFIPPFVQNILDKIELQSLSTTVFLGDSISSSNIADINATIGTRKWELFDGFTIDSISVSWSCLNPTNPEYKHHMLCFQSQFTIHEITFEVEISSEQIISGIAQGEMSLNYLLENTFKDANLPLPFEIIFNEFEIYMDVSKKEYYFSAQAYIDLDILDGKSLIMNDTRFEIGVSSTTGENNVSSPNKTYSASIQGYLQLAGAYVYLNSNYSKDNSSSGWNFQGSTGDGQEIAIGKLIEDIANLFGSVTLPSAIEDLTIQNLGVSFNTKTKDFRFNCQGKFPVDNQEIDITITIAITRQENNSFKKEFTGYIIVNNLQFNLIFSKDNNSKTLLATYNNPNGDSLIIKTLIADISSDIATYIPASLQITLKDALFIYNKTTETTTNNNNNLQNKSNFLLGLNLSSQINLTNLPLVGKQLPPEQTISIDDLQLIIASQQLTTETVNNFNNLLPPEITKIPLQLSQQTTEKKPAINISANLNFGGTTEILALPVASENTPTTNQSGTSTEITPTTPTDNTQWYPLHKNFGPLYFARIGIQYQNATLYFLLDASITGAGLTLTLVGLSIGSPLQNFQPKFDLKGIGISYKSSGAVEIGGTLIHTQDNGSDLYNGAVIIKTETFTISALGSYTTIDNQPSLFIYGVLDKPIGGPPFFFVIGLALGFAYNRSLILPNLDQIANFPLVKAAYSNKTPDLAALNQIQTELNPYIPPKIGDIVLAIGIRFTSFKIIDTFALLVANFGNEFSLSLLGISTITSPPSIPNSPTNVPPLAQVRFVILARFVPSEGTLKVDGKILPDSYLFDKKCQLSGGFAFYSWFKGDHSGDFVLTLGGYHPNFNVPAHYPKVAPLQLNWQINSELSIKGSVYFALTSAAIMAGGRLEAVWQSGDLKAWFIANANFIVAWKPYYYDARISLRIGASYTFNIKIFGWRIHKTISVEVGADLHIWGPEFAGTATVDLSIISFTIRFGNQFKPQPKPISWDEFKQSFLPTDKEVCSIAFEGGLTRQLGEGESAIWVVNPKEFCLITNSIIPIKSYSHVSQGANTNQLGIAPMNIKSNQFTKSEYTINITQKDKNNQSINTNNNFSFEPIYKNVPSGLWGESIQPNLNGKAISNILSGFKIKPANPPTAGTTKAIPIQTLLSDPVNHEKTCSLKDEFSAVSKEQKDIKKTVVNPPQNRNLLLLNLGLSQSEIDQINLQDFSLSNFDQAFIKSPELSIN